MPTPPTGGVMFLPCEDRQSLLESNTLFHSVSRHDDARFALQATPATPICGQLFQSHFWFWCHEFEFWQRTLKTVPNQSGVFNKRENHDDTIAELSRNVQKTLDLF